MSERCERIILGRIIAVHGLKGWLKIHSECRPREAIFKYREFTVEYADSARHDCSLDLLEGRVRGRGLIARFDGIVERDQAMSLLGSTLSVPRSALPEANCGEYYWSDLIGLEVVNRAGEALGNVRELFETGANDVLVVTGKTMELLIPFVSGMYIDTVDLNARRLYVDWHYDWSTGAAEKSCDHGAY